MLSRRGLLGGLVAAAATRLLPGGPTPKLLGSGEEDIEVIAPRPQQWELVSFGIVVTYAWIAGKAQAAWSVLGETATLRQPSDDVIEAIKEPK